MSDQKICPTCGTEYPLSERFCPRDGTALRSANASADLLGSVVAERYHILKKLGEGGMGTVYLAEHVKMGRKSALKVMNPGMNTDPDAIARFNREAANASRLSHPNICGIYDFGETPDGLIYLAMEFIEGTALTDLIEADGQLAPPRAASIVHQTADALQVAHDAGIVHRDLKPDNIMVAKSRDGSDLVKVVDFGIAKASSSDAQKVTKTGLVVGTPEYMSPEQLAGDKLDGRSDIYSLGLVAFNCLTGKLPFPSETAQEAMIMRLTDRPRTLQEMAPEFMWPAELQQVIDKALARDAADRYQSAAQFGRDFSAAASAMRTMRASSGETLVVNAKKVTPVSADAVTKAIPATRVGDQRDSVRTPAKGGAAVPAAATGEKKSLVPMVAGGGVLAVAAVVGWMMFGQPKAPAADAGPEVAGAPQQDADTLAGNGTDSTPAMQPLSNPVNPPAQPNRTGKSSTSPTSTPETNTAPAGPTVSQQLADWRQRLEATGTASTPAEVSRAQDVARTVLREMADVVPGLTGIQLDDARYLQLLANFSLENKDEVCRLGSLVAASRLLPERESGLGTALREQMECP